MEERLVKLVNYLMEKHCGELKAISTKELVSKGYCKTRELRFMVRDLRKSGYPVCSCTNGYYIASSNSDIQSTVNILESHITAIKETINSLKDIKI